MRFMFAVVVGDLHGPALRIGALTFTVGAAVADPLLRGG
jgi:F420-0:gamma-glutamyl ligase